MRTTSGQRAEWRRTNGVNATSTIVRDLLDDLEDALKQLELTSKSLELFRAVDPIIRKATVPHWCVGCDDWSFKYEPFHLPTCPWYNPEAVSND